jgi:hypothetical protein
LGNAFSKKRGPYGYWENYLLLGVILWEEFVYVYILGFGMEWGFSSIKINIIFLRKKMLTLK